MKLRVYYFGIYILAFIFSEDIIGEPATKRL